MDQKKIQELQMLDQQTQIFLAQKQASQVELNETANALQEIKKSNEAYKIIGNIMIKASPNDLKKDLEEKKKIIDLRISSMEKQEKIMEEKSSELRKEINDSLESKDSTN